MGGHLSNLVFTTGGGGGVVGTNKFFEMLVVFGVLHRSCQNAKNYQVFEKNFCVSTRRCKQGYTNAPPHRCVRRKTLYYWNFHKNYCNGRLLDLSNAFDTMNDTKLNTLISNLDFVLYSGRLIQSILNECAQTSIFRVVVSNKLEIKRGSLVFSCRCGNS